MAGAKIKLPQLLFFLIYIFESVLTPQKKKKKKAATWTLMKSERNLRFFYFISCTAGGQCVYLGRERGQVGDKNSSYDKRMISVWNF